MKKTAITVAEWAVLLPLWRKLLQKPWQHLVAASGTGLVWLIVIAAAAGGGGGDKNGGAVSNPEATRSEAGASPTSEATSSPTGIQTEAPTPTLEPTPEPTAAPQPVVLEGIGQTATDRVKPPSSASVVTFTHSGSSNFAVWMYQGSQKDLLVNTIGSYSGSRPIFGDDEVYFDIDADGAWSLTINPIGPHEDEDSASPDEETGLGH